MNKKETRDFLQGGQNIDTHKRNKLVQLTLSHFKQVIFFLSQLD